MAKVLPILAIFALGINLFSGLLLSTGAAATMGIHPAVSGDGDVQNATSQARQFKSGAPTGSTLFGMYNVVSGVLSVLASPVTGLPNMLQLAGAPNSITNRVVKPVLLVIYAMGIASFMRGYSLND